MDDTEQEDMDLYGEAVEESSDHRNEHQAEAKLDVGHKSELPPPKHDQEGDSHAEQESNADPVTEPTATMSLTDHGAAGVDTPNHVDAAVANKEALIESTTQINGEGDLDPAPSATDVKSGPDPVGNENHAANSAEDTAKTLQGSDVTDEAKTQAEEKNDDSSGEEEEESEDDEDGDNDEESDDDDFDVILKYDDAEAQAKPPSASFGSIGKVRLSSNKWQRPGYVAPERVIGGPTPGAARTGGVLAMLPTPTMQIGGSQKSVYDLEIGKLTEKPWLDRNADLSDYFNYGFNEETWKLYCERQKEMRLEASMLAKIKTVDGSKAQVVNAARLPGPGSPKPLQNQSAAGVQIGVGAANRRVQTNSQPQLTNQPPPQPPPQPPGMMPHPMAFDGPPGAMPHLPPGMPKIPNMLNLPGMPPNMPPFHFPHGPPNAKGGGFQPPFPPFPHHAGNQRNGDGKGGNMFPMLPPGMAGMPPGMAVPPGNMPSHMGRDGNSSRGFLGEMQIPHNLQKQGNPPQAAHGPGEGQNRDDMKRTGTQGHQGSRFSNSQGNQQRTQQPGRPGQHENDRRQRWGDNRAAGDRRQGYDRPEHDRDRGRGRGYDDRNYGERGHDRRRWNERDDGHDRRRGGGFDNQRYPDNRREYDRDRDRDYRKRSSSGRNFDEDRKRARR